MGNILLADFDITEERGFLTPHNMETVTLPEAFKPLETAGYQLTALMSSGRIRYFLNQLPEIDMAAHLPHLSHAQCRLLMIHYSFIVQAYVWAESEAPKCLPRNLALPYCLLADHLEQFPLLPYSAYTLDNWAKLDPQGEITLDNLRVIQNFYNGQDENWFIMVHIEIEAKAGKALTAIPGVLDAVDQTDVSTLKQKLADIVAAWDLINPVFDRMVERCDPYIYYLRVRPYIHGWKGNPALPEGLIYEGVEKYEGKPQAFRGQTGSQSSIVPTMDALLGIAHKPDPMRHYLDELHAYRPQKHRAFIDMVQQRSQLRAFVSQQNDPELTKLYNTIVSHVQQFRTRHLEYAASYINKQALSAEGNPTETGTGGTPFMEYLKKHRDESEAHLLPV